MKQNKKRNMKIKNLLFGLLLVGFIVCAVSAQTYPIVDTDQTLTYNNTQSIAEPASGEAFYGQDAQHNGNQPSYTDNGDGTITDNITGLTWVKARGEKMSWADAFSGAENCDVGGFEDWRMPTIKELYSLILFSGNTGITIETSNPFLNDDYFEFEYGDESAGERIIDCQDWSATRYVHFTMNGDSTVFGVNFADGRIKGYGLSDPMSGGDKLLYVRYVRGNTDYGVNQFIDNDDGTIIDNATGLMWEQGDSEVALNWEEALAWAQQKNGENYLGFSNWRLPNVKELQSIVDYTRSPATTNSAAIDPVFNVTELDDGDYPWYYTSTTHQDGPPGNDVNKAAYVCFGKATGWMEAPPPGSGNYQLMDVHGAGAQRSDFKSGDPDDYPFGHGPQGDVIRIYNQIKLVRDVVTTATPETGEESSSLPTKFELQQNYPNPFNSTTKIQFSLPDQSKVTLSVMNMLGQEVTRLVDRQMEAGNHSIEWIAETRQGDVLPSGLYFCHLITNHGEATTKMILLK